MGSSCLPLGRHGALPAGILLLGGTAGNHLEWEGLIAILDRLREVTAYGSDCFFTLLLPTKHTHCIIRPSLKKIRKYLPFNCPRESVACWFYACPRMSVQSSSSSNQCAGIWSWIWGEATTVILHHLPQHREHVVYLHPNFERVCVAEVCLSWISLLGRV